MTSPFTRSGARRAGDDYQDVVAAELLVDFLEHPEWYDWVTLEADNAGALDDCVARRSDGAFVYRQVKFTVDPDDESYEIGWDYLLAQKSGKEGPLPSRLQKWADSLSASCEQQRVAEASLQTNRRPSAELRTCLVDKHVVVEQVPAPELARMEDQIGAADVRSFLAVFEFNLERPSPVALEDAVRRRFQHLGGTDLGWLNLKESIRSWAKRKDWPPDRRITVRHIRDAGLWHDLQAIPQGFEVPADFVIPSSVAHARFVADLRKGAGSLRILWGGPGAGKSTYLSFVVSELRAANVPVLRHHYFLAVADRTPRTDHFVAAESLMQQLVTRYPEALGECSTENPNSSDLSKWLETAGHYFTNRNERLILIIDGLDHVWRERVSTSEIDLLFEAFTPPPPGVVLVVGTQRLASDQLPARLMNAAQLEDWLEIPRLSTVAMEQWVRGHSTELGIPVQRDASDHFVSELAGAFFEVSGGHPLHLKYSLKALLAAGAGRVDERAVRALPECPDGAISKYYESLWRRIAPEGKNILHLLAGTSFPWPRDGIFDVLAAGPGNLAMVSQGLDQVQHVLARDGANLSFFHSSMAKFVQDIPDHGSVANRLRLDTLTWLKTKAPPLLRWGHLWRMQAVTGDTGPIIEQPNENWAVDAVALCKPLEQALSILETGGVLALDSMLLTHWTRLGILEAYVRLAIENHGPVLDDILAARLGLGIDLDLPARLISGIPNLTNTELVILAESFGKIPESTTPKACQHILRERREISFERANTRKDEFERFEEQIARVAVAAGNLDPGAMAARLTWLKEHDACEQLFADLCATLSKFGRTKTVAGLIALEQPQLNIYCLTLAALRLACEEGVDIHAWTLTEACRNSAPSVCHEILTQGRAAAPRLLPTPINDYLNLKEHDLYATHPGVVRWLHELFFCTFATHLIAQGPYEDEWVHRLAGDKWSYGFVRHLTRVATDIAERFRARTPETYGAMFLRLGAYPRPKWGDDRDGYRYSVQACRAIYEIATDLLLLCNLINAPGKITQTDLNTIATSSYWEPELWVEVYAEFGRPLLNDDAAVVLLSDRQTAHRNRLEVLSERAKSYATLAKLGALHPESCTDLSIELLERTAKCVLGYGYHKDGLLFHTIQAIEACCKADLPLADCLLELAPAIANIVEFTDGDETRYLPATLAESLAQVRPNVFPAYYRFLLEQDDFANAEDSLRAYLRHVDLTDPYNQAVARTLVDSRSLNELVEWTKSGIAGANDVFAAQVAFFGRIPPEESLASSSPITSDAPVLDPASFPPERLGEFIQSLRHGSGYWDARPLDSWLEHWGVGPQAEPAFAAVEMALEKDDHLGGSSEIFDQLFLLCLRLRGREEAYKWLVRAHSKAWAWMPYYSPYISASRRWVLLKKHYPDRWREFLGDTLRRKRGDPRWTSSPLNCFPRVVRFLLLFQQNDTATVVAHSAVDATIRRFADLSFSSPEWVFG